jgi:hypothetical protein
MMKRILDELVHVRYALQRAKESVQGEHMAAAEASPRAAQASADARLYVGTAEWLRKAQAHLRQVKALVEAWEKGLDDVIATYEQRAEGSGRAADVTPWRQVWDEPLITLSLLIDEAYKAAERQLRKLLTGKSPEEWLAELDRERHGR